MKKLTDTKVRFETGKVMGGKVVYWWELWFAGCGLDASFNELTSKDYKSKKARDNNWAKFAKLNNFAEK